MSAATTSGLVWLAVIAALLGLFSWLCWRFRALSDAHAELFDQLFAARGECARHRALRSGFAARILKADRLADEARAELAEAFATIEALQTVVQITGEGLDDAVEDVERLSHALMQVAAPRDAQRPATVLEIVR